MTKFTLAFNFLAFISACSSLQAASTGLPDPNPWVADSAYAISHHNPAQTDMTPVDGPTRGQQLTLDDVKTVSLLWCSAPTYKHIGKETVVIASNPMGLIKVRATGEDFELISNVPYPNREEELHRERPKGCRR